MTPPNVLLIVVDTLRRDHLGAYGYERSISPSIDALAASAVRYDHAVSQAPWTTASMGSLMTSRYPGQLGIRGTRSILDDDLLVLAEAMQAGGYSTQAVVSNIFCSSRWNFDQGFDAFDESQMVFYRTATSPGVTERALALLPSGGTKPFFMWVHYFDPHNHYLLHPEFDPTPGVHYDGLFDEHMGFHQLQRRLARFGPRDIAQMVRNYDSEIGFTDHSIGVLLDELRHRGLYDSTLIIFTADHGEEFMDHGGLGHDQTLYDELVDVPLIIKYPGAGAGVVRRVVALIDLYPTILAEAGIAPPARLEGSPLPRPGAPPGTGRWVFTETSRRAELRGAVSDRYKAILRLPGSTFEFYDLDTDPAETTNLADTGLAAFAAHRDALMAWQRSQVREAGGPGPRLTLTGEERRRLRSLGYVEDDEP
ncbi:MAG: sulfatase [Acidobacteriota bacterium]